MVDNDYTNIRVKKKTAKEIRERGKKGETYDEIIIRLLEEKRKEGKNEK